MTHQLNEEGVGGGHLTAKGWKALKDLGMSALSCMNNSAGLESAGVPVTQIALASRATIPHELSSKTQGQGETQSFRQTAVRHDNIQIGARSLVTRSSQEQQMQGQRR